MCNSTFVFIFAALVAVVSLSASADEGPITVPDEMFVGLESAIPGKPGLDPLRVAQAVAGFDIALYECDAYLYLHDLEGKPHYVYVSFRLVPGVGINYMAAQMDDEELVTIVAEGDQPLSGFPSGLWKIDNFGLSVNGMDVNGNYVVYGYTAPAKEGNYGLRPGQPITVTLKPAFTQRFIAFDAAYLPQDGTLVLRLANGQVFYYDSYLGGFRIWVDPTLVVPYQIENPVTGEVVYIGELDPLEQSTVPQPTESVINLTEYVGGVIKLPLEIGESIERINQTFTGEVNLPGIGTEQAKVYFVNKLAGEELYVSAWRDGFNPVTGVELPRPNIAIYRWVPQGEMLLLRNTQGWVSVSGEDTVIVVIRATDPSDIAPFSLSGILGGGKG